MKAKPINWKRAFALLGLLGLSSFVAQPALAQDEESAPSAAEEAAETVGAAVDEMLDAAEGADEGFDAAAAYALLTDDDEANDPSLDDEQTAAVIALHKETVNTPFFDVSNLWLLISAFLVFIMHLGFATLESGLTQQKNTVNILFKNCFIISIGVLTYYFFGFNLHYPAYSIGDWFPFPSFGIAAPGMFDQSGSYADYTYWTDFIFQAMFAATAATIVSGAVAERVKLSAFMIHATILVGIAYTWAGSWHWGGGFLSTMGTDGSMAFYDFAGSTVVHGFGGFAALAFVLVLGPRKGKYLEGGRIKPILGHSMPLATIGVFLLFLGWFGFNGGSVLNADPDLVSLVFVTTTLSAVAGCMGSIGTAWIMLKKPDLSMALNGFLAGLVGITAGADIIPPLLAVVTGLLAGILVVFSIVWFDKVKIDDPVGAISVHGICGIWGTLACALFGGQSWGGQVAGILAVCLFAFAFSYVVALVLKLTMGVRVSEEEEIEGLDLGEHGQEAYPDFTAAHKG